MERYFVMSPLSKPVSFIIRPIRLFSVAMESQDGDVGLGSFEFHTQDKFHIFKEACISGEDLFGIFSKTSTS
jgi:hypothetical protein